MRTRAANAAVNKIYNMFLPKSFLDHGWINGAIGGTLVSYCDFIKSYTLKLQ